MKPELKERFERLGPIQAIARVPSGSPADIVLRPEGARAAIWTIDAIRALIRRHVPARAAMAAIDTLVARGEAVVQVPAVDSGLVFAAEMKAAGLSCRTSTEI